MPRLDAASPRSSASNTARPDALAMTSHTLVTPEFNLHYDLHGSPDAPHKVLLIMGLLTDGAAWAYQADAFKRRGYQCVTYDNRGVAGSSTPKWPLSYTTKAMANDALLLVDHLQWEQFHVVGISMGGMIATELALMIPPERIVSLTLMVTHAGGWAGLAPWSGVWSMATSIFTRSEEARLAAIMRMLYTKATLADSKLAQQLRQHHLERMKTRVPPKLSALLGHTLAVYRHYVSYTNLLRIRYAPYPTLVVVGEDDQLVQMSNSDMLARVLAARKVVIRNGGHGMLAEYPEEVNNTLLAFFKEGEQLLDKRRDRLASPDSVNTNSDEARSEEGDFSIESQETLIDGESSDSPYTLEEQALSLACSHSVHCSMHNLAGFLTGFFPAALFRYVFFDNTAAHAPHPIGVTRWEQAIRFGLLIGMLRASYRAVRCVLHAYRARQWVRRYQLLEERAAATPKNNAPTPQVRRLIPRGTAFEFPAHSLLLLLACGIVAWKKQLLTI